MKNYFNRNKKTVIAILVGTMFVGFFIFMFVLTSSPLNSGGKKFTIFISANNNGAEIEKIILDSLYQDSESPKILYYKWEITSFFKSPKKFPPGRYTLNGDLSARSIFNKILSGNEDPITLRIDNIKSIFNLAQRFGKNFEQDSSKFMNYVNENLDLLAPNTTNLPNEIRQQRVLERLIGDTYEMYWSNSPAIFFSRMNKIYTDFWNNEKNILASQIGLSEHDVYVLASIVRGETSNKDEAPEVAGLYLNRIKQGMLLQSDPTVLFAINTKEKRQRVLNEDLKFDSPYNTYVYKGLPPATIHIVEKRYLDAVLNPVKHEYIFMCAQPRKTGKHNFAKTYSEHLMNARLYRSYLDSIDIQR
jgi:UPF0755 protein